MTLRPSIFFPPTIHAAFGILIGSHLEIGLPLPRPGDEVPCIMENPSYSYPAPKFLPMVVETVRLGPTSFPEKEKYLYDIHKPLLILCFVDYCDLV